jgi:hypothetical protein
MTARRHGQARVFARAAILAGLAGLSSCAGTEDSGLLPRERSPELDELEMLVGRWESTSESVLEDTGEVLLVTSWVEADWALNREFIITKAHFLIEGGRGPDAWGREVMDIGVFTWDADAGVHRTWHFNEQGIYAEGTMKYVEALHTWRLSEESIDRRTGERVRGEGTMHYLSEDERSIEWTSTPLSNQGGGFASRGHSMRTAERP